MKLIIVLLSFVIIGCTLERRDDYVDEIKKKDSSYPNPSVFVYKIENYDYKAKKLILEKTICCNHYKDGYIRDCEDRKIRTSIFGAYDLYEFSDCSYYRMFYPKYMEGSK